MQIVAEMWLVLQLTHSGVAVGVAAALQFAPMLLGGAWGGLIADRCPQAAAADRDADGDGAPGARAARAHRDAARSSCGCCWR